MYSPVIDGKTLGSAETEAKIKEMFDISRVTRDAEYYAGCFWWKLTYGHLVLSIYFDPSDILGVVGSPYYELYDGKDTFRYLESGSSVRLLEALTKAKEEYIKEFQDHPESFL